MLLNLPRERLRETCRRRDRFHRAKISFRPIWVQVLQVGRGELTLTQKRQLMACASIRMCVHVYVARVTRQSSLPEDAFPTSPDHARIGSPTG